jgi:long-chain acyl-CoA synthetase
VERKALHEYIDFMGTWAQRNYLVGYKGYRKKPWTYGRVRSAILRLSRELARRKINKGDRVILFGRSSPEWIVAYFAVIHRGAIVVPLDPQTQPEFFYRVVTKTEPVVVICDTPFENGGIETIPLSSIETYGKETEGIQASPVAVEPASIRPEDTAEIVFTSGTTSDPKGVVLTHGNILSNLKPFEEGIARHERIIRLLTPFRILCAVPFSHMFGQFTGIFVPLLLGSTVYFTAETGPALLVREIRRDKILALITVPRVLKLLAEHVRAELVARAKLKRFERRWNRWVRLPYPLRVFVFLDIHLHFGLHFWSFIVGGAPLDPDTHEFWRRLVYSIFQGYGLTETAPIVTMFNPFRHNRSSVGKILPGQEVKFNEEGELLVRGGNVMAGYWNDPETTASVMENGWLKTGDFGKIDENGHIFIHGRKKDMIVTADGHNVYPEDIERLLTNTDGVREGIVVGLPAEGGEIPYAVLIVEPGTDPETVVKNVNAQLLPYQRIRGFSMWPDIDFPRTPTLKIRKAEVLKTVMASQNKSSEKDEFDLLLSGTVNKNTRLGDELGMSSLDLVEAISKIEKRYNVSIDESLISPETTIEELRTIATRPTASRTLRMPRWTRRTPVKLFRMIAVNLLILPVFRLFAVLEVRGRKHITGAAAPAIIIANHTSHLDPLAILSVLPLRMRGRICPAMGLNRFRSAFEKYGHLVTGGEDMKERTPPSFQKKLKSFVFKIGYLCVTLLFQTFPFPQGTAYRASLEYTGELLDAGYWILIFPEGEVSESGDLQPFRGGTVLLSENTGADVYPVFIDGMQKLLPPGKYIPRRNIVRVHFGPPVVRTDEKKETYLTKIENAVRTLQKGLL